YCQYFFRTIRDKFISFVIAESHGIVSLRTKKRTFVDHEHGFSTKSDGVRDRRASRATSNYHNVEFILIACHIEPTSHLSRGDTVSVYPRYSRLRPKGGSSARSQSK